MLPVSFSFGSLAAASANNIALSQTPVSGTKLTINGATATGGVATLDQARRVLLTFGNEASNRTMVITGTNASGNAIQETVAIASGAGATVFTVQDYLTVTSALPLGGGWTAAVTLGTNAQASSPWKFTNNPLWSPAQIGFNLTQTGTLTWWVELTDTQLNSNMSQLGAQGGNYAPVPNTFFANSGLSSQTTGTFGAVSEIPFVAWRVRVSGTGALTVEAIEAGMH
jgi:hypothetical protein